MRTRIIAGISIATTIGLIVWTVATSVAWEGRCQDAGGHVVSEYIGEVTHYTYDAKGNITGVYTTPNYAYNCQDDRNQEIEV